MARILLVEDEPVIAYLHERIIKRLGHKITAVVKNEEDIFANLKESDVVLMDITLNDRTDGIVYCRRIKQEFPHIKVIFVSAYKWETFEPNLNNVEYDGYIDKIKFNDKIKEIL